MSFHVRVPIWPCWPLLLIVASCPHSVKPNFLGTDSVTSVTRKGPPNQEEHGTMERYYHLVIIRPRIAQRGCRTSLPKYLAIRPGRPSRKSKRRPYGLVTKYRPLNMEETGNARYKPTPRHGCLPMSLFGGRWALPGAFVNYQSKPRLALLQALRLQDGLRTCPRSQWYLRLLLLLEPVTGPH